jgi:hypothetical protein
MPVIAGVPKIQEKPVETTVVLDVADLDVKEPDDIVSEGDELEQDDSDL